LFIYTFIYSYMCISITTDKTYHAETTEPRKTATVESS